MRLDEWVDGFEDSGAPGYDEVFTVDLPDDPSLAVVPVEESDPAWAAVQATACVLRSITGVLGVARLNDGSFAALCTDFSLVADPDDNRWAVVHITSEDMDTALETMAEWSQAIRAFQREGAGQREHRRSA